MKAKLSILLLILLNSCVKPEVSEFSADEWTNLVQSHEENFSDFMEGRKFNPSLTDEDGYNFLNIACVNSNPNALEYILSEYKVSVQLLNEKSKEFESTPLISAVMSGCYNCVVLLVQNGADLELKNVFGKTALDIAIEFKRNEIINFLQNQENEELGK